jgi:hypothetical protein
MIWENLTGKFISLLGYGGGIMVIWMNKMEGKEMLEKGGKELSE